MTRADVVRATLLHERYLYEIFNGTKKPGRNKVLQLCLAFSLSIKDANHLLGSAGLSSLYSRDARDAIIIFCLLNKKSVMECNELLYEKNIDIFD